MKECLVIGCGRKFRPSSPKQLFCREHQIEFDKLETKRKRYEAEQRASREAWKRADFFIHWKGHWVGVYENDQVGHYNGKYLGDEVKVPKVAYKQGRVIDLDQWLPKYSKDQVSNLKRCFKRSIPTSV